MPFLYISVIQCGPYVSKLGDVINNFTSVDSKCVYFPNYTVAIVLYTCDSAINMTLCPNLAILTTYPTIQELLFFTYVTVPSICAVTVSKFCQTSRTSYQSQILKT